MTRCACLLSVLSLLTVGCSPFVDDDATTQGKHAIYNGERESGEEWVVSPCVLHVLMCGATLQQVPYVKHMVKQLQQLISK